jgi:hypothetical protein
MARSIASSGLSTTLPWPGASLAGSRARNAPGALKLDRTVPGKERQRAARVHPCRGRDAAERRVDIAAVEHAIPVVEQGDVPGGMPRGRNHIERAAPIAGAHGTVGPGLGAGIAAAQLRLRLVGIEAHVPSEKPRVASRDDHLRLRKVFLQLVERPDLARGATDHRVDQRQAVVLAHEVGVHHLQPADPS